MLGHNDQQVNRFGMNPLSDPSCVMKEASSSVAVTRSASKLASAEHLDDDPAALSNESAAFTRVH